MRSIYAAWEGGDFSSADWADPEIECVAADGPTEGSRTVGKPAMAEMFRDWLSTWEDWRVRADGYRELDDEQVLVPFSFSARGKASGLEVGEVWTKGATLFEVRDGLVVRLVQYLDREKAFADLALSPEP